ncbi:MAG: EFR1 family ferrodoxin [Treponema sp.]|nr:EFR1 family ferrodoxin [Treponema sp.]
MTKIYYFSGTGNTLWSAKKIAELVGGECELLNIGAEAEKTGVVIEADTVVLLFPSYAYGLPLVVHRFVKNAAIKTPYLSAFVTFGTSPGGTMTELSRLLKKKDIGSFYFGRIPAVENYIAIFGSPSAETQKERLPMQREATEEAARCITEKRTNSVIAFRPFSALVSTLFSLGVKIFYRFYRVSDDCNGCEICRQICPVSSIVMKDKRPVFSDKCEHCQGCINICPQRAIHFGRVNSGTPRYQHPEISISDLTR